MEQKKNNAKEAGRMHVRLQMMAYQELYNAMMMKRYKFTDEEKDFMTGMNLHAQEMYDNYDAFFEKIMSDGGYNAFDAGPFLDENSKQ